MLTKYTPTKTIKIEKNFTHVIESSLIKTASSDAIIGCR